MLRISIVGFVLAAAVFAPGTIDASAASNARAATSANTATATAFAIDNFSEAAIGAIETDVLELALGAASCAVKSGAVERPRTLTVIDYSKPSSQKRLWVYDLATRQLLYEELVAHGQGSGANLATQFSNKADSHQTSLGLFVTDDTYVGRNGYSLRLDGLDKGLNDLARDRAIVMHGAPYVNPAFVKANGRLGRSHGCPAVSDAVARELINRVKGGGLVFAYYPDAQFLKTSKYLGGCTLR